MEEPMRAAFALPAGVVAGALLLATQTQAQPRPRPPPPEPVQKTTLQEQGFPGPPNHTVLVKTVVARGAAVAPHTHPGAEMAYVVSGVAEVTIAGEGRRILRPGGSFSVAPGTAHSVKNAGPGPLTIVSTYVVDRDKPIASPARMP
jgi:quercetin dioxygenase-like cupin family protein